MAALLRPRQEPYDPRPVRRDTLPRAWNPRAHPATRPSGLNERGAAFAAKAGTVFGVALVVGQALAFGGYLLGQAVLHRQHLGVGLGAPGVLRSVAGAGLYLCVVTMVGFGPGALLRRPAGATAALFATVFLAYGLARAVEDWSYLPSRLLLSNAGDVVAQVHATAARPRLPSLRLAYLDLTLYCAIALGLGAWRSTRDT